MSNYIEAGSIIAIATSLGFWQPAFHFGNGFAGLLAAFSPNAFGAAIGAIIGGPLADRLGRKFIYTYDLLLYIVGMLFVIFAVNSWLLFTGFLIAGIAVGTGIPAAWTYISELAPATRRAAHIGISQVAWSLGPFVGFVLALALAPLGLFGSRLIFAWLALVALITWIVRRGLPESGIWKDHRERSAESMTITASLKALFSKRVNITALLVMFGVYAFWNTVAGQAGIFQPRIYANIGFDPVQQDLFNVLGWGWIALILAVGFSTLADRVPQRVMYGIAGVLSIAAWSVLAWAPPTTFTILFYTFAWGTATGFGFCQAFYSLWTSELFATPYRAGAQGVLFTVARLMVGFLSLWFPVLLSSLGLPGLGAVLISLIGVSWLVGTIWTPKTRGKTLRQIEIERYGENIEDLIARPDVTNPGAPDLV